MYLHVSNVDDVPCRMNERSVVCVCVCVCFKVEEAHDGTGDKVIHGNNDPTAADY